MITELHGETSIFRTAYYGVLLRYDPKEGTDASIVGPNTKVLERKN